MVKKPAVLLLLMTVLFILSGGDSIVIAKGKAHSGREFSASSIVDLADIVPADSLDGVPPDVSHSELREMIERFSSDLRSVHQMYPIDISPARQVRMKRFYNNALDNLERANFESLSQDGRVDYVLFKNYLTHRLRQLDLQVKAWQEEAPLIPFAHTIIDLRETLQNMQFVDPAKTADALNELAKQIRSTQNSIDAKLNDPKPAKYKKTVANRSSGIIKDLRESFQEWFHFYNGYDPAFSWWVGEPYKSVDSALKDYATFVREKVAGIRVDDENTIIGDPIGREALMDELTYEMIPYTPEELIAIANQEFAWCEKEMKRASNDLGYGDDWHKALEHVKTLYVEPGKQPELIRDLAREAIKFVDDHDLVTVPQLARDTWRMEMLSPEQQKYSPFFLGGEVILVSYPTNTMGHEQKMMSMRGNNIHFARATVFHELIPGHHLQEFMMDRYKQYRGLFGTPFWMEGGALYWEMLFWDLGFPKTPENRIGMLFWRMHRCARIIFSLSFHLEKMTPQECIDFLVERVGHERDNATAEVRRSIMGGYGPLYQCAYMLGGLQLRALHHEVVDSGKMTNREFHDAVLHENSIPIEMIRASLTKQPLSPDFKSSWKFYGENPAGR